MLDLEAVRLACMVSAKETRADLEFIHDSPPTTMDDQSCMAKSLVDSLIMQVTEEMARPHPMVNGITPSYPQRPAPLDSTEPYGGGVKVP